MAAKNIKWMMKGNLIIVQQDRQEAVTEGGIALAEAFLQTENTGVIRALGDGVDKTEWKDCIGKRVLFAEFGGMYIMVNGQKFLALPPKSIIAIEEPQ